MKLFVRIFAIAFVIIAVSGLARAACMPDEIEIGDLESINITEQVFTFTISVMGGGEENTYSITKNNPVYYKANYFKDEQEKAIKNNQSLKLIVYLSADGICEIFKASSDTGVIRSYVQRDGRYIIKFNRSETSVVYDIYISSTNPVFAGEAESLLKQLQAIDISKEEVFITVNEDGELFECWVQPVME